MAVILELKKDQRLNRFGATQFTAELGSISDLTRVQSWTTLVQRAFSLMNTEINQNYQSNSLKFHEISSPRIFKQRITKHKNE